MKDPTQPEQLTPEWLSVKLGSPIRGFEIERFGEGMGVIGQVCRLRLDGDTPHPTIIAKFPSPSPDNRAVAATYDMYGREVRFYQHIAQRVPMRTPECWYAAHNPATNEFVLLLEDLGAYRLGDQVAGCTLADAEAVIGALARLHAGAWNPGDEFGLVPHDTPAQRDGMIAGFQLGWPVVLERFADLVPPAALVAGERMPAATPGLLEAMCTPPVCLTHADVRLDNIFFVDANTDVLPVDTDVLPVDTDVLPVDTDVVPVDTDAFLVDWQSVCASAPEQDLAYFLTQSVPRDVAASADLRSLYYDQLTAHGVSYPRATFDERYRICALYLLNYAVIIAGTLDLGNERGARLGRTLLGGALAALDQMNAFELL